MAEILQELGITTDKHGTRKKVSWCCPRQWILLLCVFSDFLVLRCFVCAFVDFFYCSDFFLHFFYLSAHDHLLPFPPVNHLVTFLFTTLVSQNPECCCVMFHQIFHFDRISLEKYNFKRWSRIICYSQPVRWVSVV